MWLELSPTPELYFIPEQASVQTCGVSLLGHIWPTPWTGALRLAGQIPSEKEGFLSFSRWQAAFGSLRDEAREGCWCYCDAVSGVIWENHLPWVSPHPSHCQDSDSGLDCLSHLVSVSAVFKSPPPICHPMLLTFSIISLTWDMSPEAGQRFLPQPCSQQGKAPCHRSIETLHHTVVLGAAAGRAMHKFGRQVTWVWLPLPGKALNCSESLFPYLQMGVVTPVLPHRSVLGIKRSSWLQESIKGIAVGSDSRTESRKIIGWDSHS